MPDVLVMHGINLDMFGQRDPAHYGVVTLDEINTEIAELAAELDVDVDFFQSNREGDFVGRIHAACADGTGGILVNAGAWTHYSYGIMDALAMFKAPVVEVHMSHVHAREEFRRFSVLAPVARGSIEGFGVDSYLLGLRALAGLIGK